jgi:hypothetical protein
MPAVPQARGPIWLLAGLAVTLAACGGATERSGEVGETSASKPARPEKVRFGFEDTGTAQEPQTQVDARFSWTVGHR